MRRWLPALIPALLFALAPPAAGITVPGGDLAADTVWEGTVEVTDEVRVAAGATLLVQPGTTVRFSPALNKQGEPRARLVVHGSLVAQGTAEKPILFDSAAGNPEPGSWGGIVFEHSGSQLNRISHATIRHATTGLTGSYASFAGEDLTIRGCYTGVWAMQDFKGRLLRATVTANESGIYYRQSSELAIDDSRIAGNSQVGVFCTLGSSPAVRFSTVADNGERGIACLQGSSPLIEGNVITGHRAGVYLELQVRARIVRNLLSGNETAIWGEKMTSPEIAGNTITGNGVGIYCNYSTYPEIHGNNILGNRSFGVVIGDNMSILMEEKIPFRHLGKAFFGAPPPAATLPPQSRKFQPFARAEGGIIDARGNWWGAAATAEMTKLPPDGNSSAIEDYFDKPDTFHDGEKYRRDRVAFTPWEPEEIKDAGIPPKPYAAVRGRVVADGKPVAGARVHAYPEAAGGFRGPGATFSAPTASDGSFALDLRGGAWFLAAKAPVPPFPQAEPAADALFGILGGEKPAAVTLEQGRTTEGVEIVVRKVE